MDYGDDYGGLYRDYYRDRFPHSLLSTRELRLVIRGWYSGGLGQNGKQPSSGRVRPKHLNPKPLNPSRRVRPKHLHTN